jgi:hypothetical protein
VAWTSQITDESYELNKDLQSTINQSDIFKKTEDIQWALSSLYDHNTPGSVLSSHLGPLSIRPILDIGMNCWVWVMAGIAFSETKSKTAGKCGCSPWWGSYWQAPAMMVDIGPRNVLARNGGYLFSQRILEPWEKVSGYRSKWGGAYQIWWHDIDVMPAG